MITSMSGEDSPHDDDDNDDDDDDDYVLIFDFKLCERYILFG